MFLSPTFVLANLHPLKNMREVSLSTAEHHVRASGANTNRLPKRQEEKTFGVHWVHVQISPRVSVPTGCGGGKDYPSYSSFMGDIFIIVLLYYTIALSISTEEPDKPLVMASHRSTAADSQVGRAMGTYLAHSDLLHLPKLSAVTGKRG